jgi:hypothetical protein
MRCWRFGLLLLLIVCLQAPLYAVSVNGEIVQQQLDGDGNGYTVVRVWGTHYEMGYAQGYLLSEDIAGLIDEFKSFVSSQAWARAREPMEATIFKPTFVDEHLRGMVDGMKAGCPEVKIDVLDLKVFNTAGDWLYAMGCRSHSCWGSFVASPVKTLTTRRLDWAAVDVTHNHVLCAYDPSDDSDSWVGLGFPGTLAAGTLVTASGTLVAGQDFHSRTEEPGSGPEVMTRGIAGFYAAVMDLPASAEKPLEHVYQELRQYTPYVGGFLCYYAPDGDGGVITFSPSQGFYDKRTPEESYFGGDMLMTTNSWTDGTTTPEDGEFMHDYYAAGGTKSLADHWCSMGDPECKFHQLSVEVRGPEDMTIWFQGRIPGGNRTPRVTLEWSELFGDTAGVPD